MSEDTAAACGEKVIVILPDFTDRGKKVSGRLQDGIEENIAV